MHNLGCRAALTFYQSLPKFSLYSYIMFCHSDPKNILLDRFLVRINTEIKRKRCSSPQCTSHNRIVNTITINDPGHWTKGKLCRWRVLGIHALPLTRTTQRNIVAIISLTITWIHFVLANKDGVTLSDKLRVFNAALETTFRRSSLSRDIAATMISDVCRHFYIPISRLNIWLRCKTCFSGLVQPANVENWNQSQLRTVTSRWWWEQPNIGLNECDSSLAIFVQPPMMSTARHWGLKR